jgi:signal transduction histidine kinase
MLTLERNLRWYIAIRVVAVTSVLLPFFLLQLARPGSFPAVATRYVLLLAVCTFAATLVYIALTRLLRRQPAVQAYIQFSGDLLLITVMVYYLGGVASPFSLLYLIVIAVASTLLRRRAGVTVASLAFLLYAGLTLSLSFGWLPAPPELAVAPSEVVVPYPAPPLSSSAATAPALQPAPGASPAAQAAPAAPATSPVTGTATAAPAPLAPAAQTPRKLPVSPPRGGPSAPGAAGSAAGPLESPIEELTGWRVTYNLAIHFFGFYAMALLTSLLAHNATRAERELEVKSEHLADLQVVHRDVIQSISSGLITTDLVGLITSVNQAGLAILRLSQEKLMGGPIHQSGLMSGDQWQTMTSAGQLQGKLRIEVQVPHGDGAASIGFSISRLNDAFGAHRGYILIFQDLTGWRRMQDELRMKDRMAAVGELAAGLAHEIGNPLAAISGSVQMLSSARTSGESQRRLIDILLKESHRLDRTIKGFLRFARPRERTSVPFDIARLLSENMELFANSEEVSPHHHLDLDLQPVSARVIADPDQVSQIFWNLARNAMRAMPEGGTFRLVGRLDGEIYRLQVIDTGEGMSEAQRANLFHPFQSFFDGGTGIGMAIVYRIVEDHGGRLRVESTPGGGTTITVELPAAGPGRPLASPPQIAGIAAEISV